DPLVLLKNLDHVRMTSRRLSYILQQQVHLYTPEANQLREQIDTYVEAERQIEGEMARRRIRAEGTAVLLLRLDGATIAAFIRARSSSTISVTVIARWP